MKLVISLLAAISMLPDLSFAREISITESKLKDFGYRFSNDESVNQNNSSITPPKFNSATHNSNLSLSKKSCSCDFTEIVEKVSPAVVNISTEKKIKLIRQLLPSPPGEFLDPYSNNNQIEKALKGSGSGFIIDSAGIIVTSYHVISEAAEITVILSNNEQYKAKILGIDPKTDLAVIKIEAKEPLPFLEFGDSTSARVGEWIIAIGNPFGFGGSVSMGIISARGRDNLVFGKNAHLPFISDFIQTDAAINHGNSGGPLINIEGKVLGINSALYSLNGYNAGVGFAISSDTAQPIIKILAKGKQVERGWIGIDLQEVDKGMAEGLDRKDLRGAPLVADIHKDSPAEKAGMQRGDIIVEFNGQKLTSAKQMHKIVSRIPVNTETIFKVLRGTDKKTNPYTIKLKIGHLNEKPTAVVNTDKYEVMGVIFSELPEGNSKFPHINTDMMSRVIVTSLRVDNQINDNFRVGDIITSVWYNKINTLEEFKSIIEKEKKSARTKVYVSINRKGRNAYTGLQIK